ncbi:MAG: gluconokinase [Pelomonas sp.]|nr:gluconokinase [Roseateles sp.]
MGVAGCGKSSLAQVLGAALGWPVIEGDDFHPPRNKALMQAGTPLTDADRAGWLDALGAELARHEGGVLLSCSALKRAYRERLRDAVRGRGLRFVFLELDEAAALARVQARGGHFFNPGLVRSQFETLESPLGEPGVLRLDATDAPAALRETALQWLARPSTTTKEARP